MARTIRSVNSKKTISQVVSSTRKAKGLTLRELAAKVKLSYQTIARVEQGRGGFDANNRVLKALDVSVEERRRLLQAAVMKLVAA